MAASGSLLDSPWDALAVARRRLLPLNLPGPVDAVHIPESELTWRRRALKRVRYVRHVKGCDASATPCGNVAGVRCGAGRPMVVEAQGAG